MFLISGRRMQRLTKIALREQTIYYMGTSADPDRVHVLQVSEDAVYLQMWPFGPGTGRRSCRPGADSLISRGTATRRDQLRQLIASDPGYDLRWAHREVSRLTALLEGESVEQSELTDDWRMSALVIPAVPPGPSRFHENGGDPWYAAECYGNVTGRVLPDSRSGYLIETDLSRYEHLRQDDRFEILETETMWGSGPTLEQVLDGRRARRTKALAAHAHARGKRCRDDGLGTCAVCGVELSVCDACHSTGYHAAGCSQSEETEDIGLRAMLRRAKTRGEG